MSGTRIVLLGASNLTRYLPTVLAFARASFEGPHEVFAAHGLGRSYGTWSRVLARELPGIESCGVWPELERAARERPLSTAALVTDIGNDLVYGSPAADVAHWVERCLERLDACGARTALTQLPLASIAALGVARFECVRTLLFPRHRIALETVRTRAVELGERLDVIARARALTPVVPSASWYGLDPIHLRPTRRDEAWRAMLDAWSPAAARPLSRAEALRVRRARPAERRLFGRRLTRGQPACHLSDGGTLALY